MLLKKRNPKNKRGTYWPLLLKNYYKMDCYSQCNKSDFNGNFPFTRTIKTYIKNGILNIDKPIFLFTYPVLKWVKKFLNIINIGQPLTLESKISGCQLIFLENSIRLKRFDFEKNKTFLSILYFQSYKNFSDNIIKKLSGFFFHSIFPISNIKYELKTKYIYYSNEYEFDYKYKTRIVKFSCGYDMHLFFILNYLTFIYEIKCTFLESRQVCSGVLSEKDNLTTLHNFLDSGWIFKCKKKDFYLRKAVIPYEIIFTSYKRIMIKYSAVNSLCYGAVLRISGIIKAEKNIEKGDKVVCITKKGEVIALASTVKTIAKKNSSHHSILNIIKCVLMEKDFYPKKWGFCANQVKKNLIHSSGFFIGNKLTRVSTTLNWFV